MEENSGFFEEEEKSLKDLFESNDDNYIIGERIYVSETGFSELYLLRRSGRLFVAKALRPEYRGDKVAEAALRKEFQIGFVIDLPGVVRTFEMVSDSEIGPFIVLENCRGVNLREFMDSGRDISGEQLEKISQSLINTLRAVHGDGVIHRDIKPSNIIYDEVHGIVKLIDFGCADAFDQLRFKGSAGTPLYKSEDFKNQPADDWYALSLCLMELADYCHDRGAKKRVQSLCNTMRKGVAPELSQTKPSRHLMLPFVIAGVVVLGVVSFFIARRDIRMEERSEESVSALDTIQQPEVLLQENLKDSLHITAKTDVPDNLSSAPAIANNDRNREIGMEDKEHSQKESDLVKNDSREDSDAQKEIRKRVLEQIKQVTNELFWERERKLEATLDRSLMTKNYNEYERRYFELEKVYFDERECINIIFSRLNPFPTELPADTVKAMVVDYFPYVFYKHLGKYRVH